MRNNNLGPGVMHQDDKILSYFVLGWASDDKSVCFCLY